MIVGHRIHGWTRIMAHLFERNLVERVNTAMLLGTLWTALAMCLLAALAYDIRFWVPGW
jgi:hypothetical protein